MARIAGVDLPPRKRAEIGLTYIYGIGRTRSNSILYRTGVDPSKKISDLSEDEINRIRILIEQEGGGEDLIGTVSDTWPKHQPRRRRRKRSRSAKRRTSPWVSSTCRRRSTTR